jgi:hypothetical protein
MTFIRHINKASRARAVKALLHYAGYCATSIAVGGFDPTNIVLQVSMASSHINGAGHA